MQGREREPQHSAHSKTKRNQPRQTKLTQHFAAEKGEQCPQCPASFHTVQQLIEHVEHAHFKSTADTQELQAEPHSSNIPQQPSTCQGNSSSTPEAEEPQEQQPWWKQVPGDPVVAHVRFASSSSNSGGQQLLPLRLSALSSIAPVDLVLQALPADLANSLLAELLGQSGAWVAGSWWFGGKQQTAPRLSATYRLATSDQQQQQHDQQPNPQQPARLAAARAAEGNNSSRQQSLPLAQSASQSAPQAPQPHTPTDLLSVPQLPAPPILQQAADIISSAVSNRMTGAQHAHWQQQRAALTAHLVATNSASAAAAAAAAGMSEAAAAAARALPAADASAQPQAVMTTAQATAGMHSGQRQQQQQQQGESRDPNNSMSWRPSYVLANLYRDGQQSVGSHTDRLSQLGPLPTIASVSLGAARVFRLTPADPSVAAAAAAAVAAAAAGGAAARVGGGPAASAALGSSSGSSGAGTGRLVSSIDIQLPHNSLLIMWPPTQEQWKHEVPKTKKLTPHALSGTARINLTFRQLHPAWSAAVPDCNCGHTAIMRAAVKGSKVVYYYACDNTKGPGCGLYRLAATLEPAQGGG